MVNEKSKTTLYVKTIQVDSDSGRLIGMEDIDYMNISFFEGYSYDSVKAGDEFQHWRHGLCFRLESINEKGDWVIYYFGTSADDPLGDKMDNPAGEAVGYMKRGRRRPANE